MKDTLKKYVKYMLPALCAGIVLAVYALSESGKENILRAMDEALNETINIDFYYRSSQEMKSNDGPSQPVKKVKSIRLVGESGPEIIELKDSIEDYVANRMIVQYILY